MSTGLRRLVGPTLVFPSCVLRRCAGRQSCKYFQHTCLPAAGSHRLKFCRCQRHAPVCSSGSSRQQGGPEPQPQASSEAMRQAIQQLLPAKLGQQLRTTGKSIDELREEMAEQFSQQLRTARQSIDEVREEMSEQFSHQQQTTLQPMSQLLEEMTEQFSLMQQSSDQVSTQLAAIREQVAETAQYFGMLSAAGLRERAELQFGALAVQRTRLVTLHDWARHFKEPLLQMGIPMEEAIESAMLFLAQEVALHWIAMLAIARKLRLELAGEARHPGADFSTRAAAVEAVEFGHLLIEDLERAVSAKRCGAKTITAMAQKWAEFHSMATQVKQNIRMGAASSSNVNQFWFTSSMDTFTALLEALALWRSGRSFGAVRRIFTSADTCGVATMIFAGGKAPSIQADGRSPTALSSGLAVHTIFLTKTSPSGLRKARKQSETAALALQTAFSALACKREAGKSGRVRTTPPKQPEAAAKAASLQQAVEVRVLVPRTQAYLRLPQPVEDTASNWRVEYRFE